MNEGLDFATQLVQNTGQALLQYFSKSFIPTDKKPNHSLVTEADIVADRMISESIHTHYPSDYLISEELNPCSPDNPQGSGWIIDPLDGTTNFSLGIHYWGVLITRVVDGLPQLTAQFFPLLDELYLAQVGKGAFLNGKPIQVAKSKASQYSSFFTCCSRTFRNYHVNIPYKSLILGSAAYSMCCVSRGAALLGFDAQAKIWDIAGAWILVSEAGGMIEELNHHAPFPIKAQTDYSQQNYAILAAINHQLLEEAKNQIVPITRTQIS